MKLALKLLLVLSLSLNVGLLGAGIYRAVADPAPWETPSFESASTESAPPWAAAVPDTVPEAGFEPMLEPELEPESERESAPAFEPAPRVDTTPPPAVAELDQPAPAHAADPEHHRARQRALARHPGPPAWAARQWPQRRLGRLDRALDLSRDQRQQLALQLRPLHGQIQAISGQLAQARALLMTQLAADRIDPATARRLRARLSQAQARLDSLVTEAMLREHTVLDARQRRVHSQMLRAMVAEHAGRGQRLRSPAPMDRANQNEDDEEER